MILSDSDFDRRSWHDCHIWGIEICAGDPDRGDWTSELVLDIDFIVEWICGTETGGGFRVAPATLVFHGVTDPKIAIDWGAAGHQTAVHPASIDKIEREALSGQKVFLDRPYYRWTISLNWPAGGELSFGATGFTQVLRADPILSETQYLPRSQRGWTRAAKP
jgi:hypothetical protein